MLIVITGEKGIGKSTCCLRITEIALRQRLHCGGVITLKSPDGEIIVEDLQTGATETLAGIENKFSGPQIGKYHFNPTGIKFGAEAIEKGIYADILFIDELGYLELRGEGFAASLRLLTTHTIKPVIVVIRKELLLDFLPLLTFEPAIFELILANRNEMPAVIFSFIISTSVISPPEVQ